MVIASRGDVSVISNGESRPLRQGDFIAELDEIVANDRSFAVLQFFDGAKLSIRPDSRLIVEQFRYSGGEEDTVTLNLLAGGFRLVPGAIATATPENFRIRTPLSLMIVDGKESSITLCDETVCKQQGLLEIPQ